MSQENITTRNAHGNSSSNTHTQVKEVCQSLKGLVK